MEEQLIKQPDGWSMKKIYMKKIKSKMTVGRTTVEHPQEQNRAGKMHNHNIWEDKVKKEDETNMAEACKVG